MFRGNNREINASYIQWKYQDPPDFHPYFFETLLDYNEWKQYTATHWLYSFFICALYLVVIFSIKHLMKDREPLKLEKTLLVLNSGLGIFSLIGCVRTTQELLNVLTMPNGFHHSICTRVGLNRPAAFYSVAFVLSKIVELFETLVIVLRKRPLLFIHWYHHCAALLLAWQVMPYSEPIFRWYGVWNFLVHAIMQPYFSLKPVINVSLARKIAMLITTLQLLQMVFGVGINLYSVYVIGFHGPESCARDRFTLTWIGGIYGSFLLLFAHLFFERYILRKRKIL